MPEKLVEIKIWVTLSRPKCYGKVSECLWNGKAVWGGETNKPKTGCWVPKAHQCMRATKAIPPGPDQRKVCCGTGNDGYGRNVSHNTMHFTPLYEGPMRVPFTIKSTYNRHATIGTGLRKNVAFSDESRFLLHHVDGHVWVHHWGSDGTGMHGRECDVLGNVLLRNVNLDVNLTFWYPFIPLNEEKKEYIRGFIFSAHFVLIVFSVEDPNVDQSSYSVLYSHKYYNLSNRRTTF